MDTWLPEVVAEICCGPLLYADVSVGFVVEREMDAGYAMDWVGHYRAGGREDTAFGRPGHVATSLFFAGCAYRASCCA